MLPQEDRTSSSSTDSEGSSDSESDNHHRHNNNNNNKKKKSKRRSHERKRRSGSLSTPSFIWSSLLSLLFPQYQGRQRQQQQEQQLYGKNSPSGVNPRQCPIVSLQPTKKKYEIAIVACGSFWSPQPKFQRLRGVKRVIVGYTGGGQEPFPPPTFYDMHDHSYALLIEYNPKKITYVQLLQTWLDNDDPWTAEELWSHRSALLVTTPQQQHAAKNFLIQLAQTKPPGCPMYVGIEPAQVFYQAEDYQQDYLAKQLVACKEQLQLYSHAATPSSLFTIRE
jgi:peptide-methionine (S)-S-oxide reductase